MRSTALPVALGVLAVLALAGCSGDDSATTTAATSTSPATTDPPVDDSVWVIPVAGDLPGTWYEVLHLRYGDDIGLLGTSLGGDGEGLQIGPEYGARAADGSWHVLDVAKARVARFDADGRFLDEAVLPPEMLVDGIYVQFQLPRVLADGTFVATGLRAGATEVLTVRDGVPATQLVEREWIPRADDGTLIYGFDLDNQPVAVDISAGTVADVEWFRTRAGTRYRLAALAGGLRVELPDADPPVDRTFELRAPQELGGTVRGSVEVASGIDGTLHLFVLGFTDADESVQLAGYVQVAPDGTASAVERVRDPFTPADPGSPSRLGVAHGSTTPWLMFVDPDGVRVFERR